MVIMCLCADTRVPPLCVRAHHDDTTHRLMPSSNIVEINDPSIDHSAVTRDPAGLAGLDTIFVKLGMRKGTPPASAQAVSAPVSNQAKSVTEESGKPRG